MSVIWAPVELLFLVGIGIVVALLVASEMLFEGRRSTATARGRTALKHGATAGGVSNRRSGRRRPF